MFEQFTSISFFTTYYYNLDSKVFLHKDVCKKATMYIVGCVQKEKKTFLIFVHPSQKYLWIEIFNLKIWFRSWHTFFAY